MAIFLFTKTVASLRVEERQNEPLDDDLSTTLRQTRGAICSKLFCEGAAHLFYKVHGPTAVSHA